ncbi:TPA: hypothetical protein ACKOV4_003773 [Clostridioides difficile]
MLKDDLLRAGFDTYGVNVEEKLLENDKVYLSSKEEIERTMETLLDILKENEYKKMLIEFEENICGINVIEKEYAYRMGVLDGLDLAEFIALNKKLCLQRN